MGSLASKMSVSSPTPPHPHRGGGEKKPKKRKKKKKKTPTQRQIKTIIYFSTPMSEANRARKMNYSMFLRPAPTTNY